MSAENAIEYAHSATIRYGTVDGVTFRRKPVKYSVIYEQAIFEGDIRLGSARPPSLVEWVVARFLRRRTVPVHMPAPLGLVISIDNDQSRSRWPDGLVHYAIEDDLGRSERELIADAMDVWQTYTPIIFQQWRGERDYVEFIESPWSYCYADTGMLGSEPRQEIALAPGCTVGNLLHEIGHCVGLWHEHSREDRDGRVCINWSNIQEDAEHNFEHKIADGDDVGPYDYESVMHYHAYAYARDPNVKTILTEHPIGQRERLSAGDIAAVKALYT